MFSCVWLHFKIFFEKYFLVFRKKVGKEEGRGKTQKNPNKPRRTQRDLAIDGAISDRDRCERCFARSRHRIAIVGAISRSTIHVDRDLANGASRKIAPGDLAFFLSLVLPLRELSLRVPSSGNHLK